MKWYYKNQGTHTHVRVFKNGASCGNLTFRIVEFEEIRRELNVAGYIEFINETPQPVST